MTQPSEDLRIDYVEFNVGDIERSKTFYGSAFGWRFTDYGPNYCEFDDGRLRAASQISNPRARVARLSFSTLTILKPLSLPSKMPAAGS